ncbi:MAG: pseudaminic acid synthase [Sutterellaceae bacterium]|nr:pseudaminic acid synthase [Burkholderiaceae bacterium]MDW8429040.1 pseudaminic acid synthase [Sutterellaceae bacterium]
MSIQIGNHQIGIHSPPFVIAEMSGNHNGSLERALAIVDAVADAGAQAVKLQTYTADTMTLDIAAREFIIDEPTSLWAGRTLYDLYREAHTPWAWHAPIFERARARGLVAFSTPFDSTAVDFLESLDVPCYKIASFENVDLPLIRKVAATGKPLIISTGLATLAEIGEAVAAAREAGCRELVLLKCTSAYPASPADSNLRTIPHLRAAFGCEVGLSDHTIGIGAALAAIALGATVIEKHVTLCRADGGVDSAFSLEPHELRLLVQESERARLALGEVRYGPTADEVGSLRFRRSLYVVRDIRKGEVLTPENVRAIRPGFGLAPRYLEQVLGRRAAQDIQAGTALRWELVA